MDGWTPDLTGRSGPKYLQIAQAIAEAVRDGSLPPGAQLPSHRLLAYAIGVSPQTTSRAYAEGVTRAILTGEVGRGTFVRSPQPAPPSPIHPATGAIDFAQNFPHPGSASAALASTLARLGRDGDLAALVQYRTAPAAGIAPAAIAWLSGGAMTAADDETAITIGAQHAIMASLAAIARPGDLVLTEALTYAPVRALAARLGLRLSGVALDDDGLCPDDLGAKLAERRVRALYLTPTLQTPTASVLAADRRAEIVALARRHDVLVIEDDVYAPLVQPGPAPISALAPERSVHISSVSKALAPGLRIGFVRAPARLAAAIRTAVTLSCWMPPPLMATIAARWIADGTGARLLAEQRATARRRQAMAKAALPAEALSGHEGGIHAWLRPPEGWTASRLRAAAAEDGVRIADTAAFAVTPGAAETGLRLCLAHEGNDDRVERGLSVLARRYADDRRDLPPVL